MENLKYILYVRNTILNKIIKGYIVGDLKRMLEIKVIPNHDGNLNFPILLYALSSISFLGYLIAEKELKHDSQRIKTYIKTIFIPEDFIQIEPHLDLLTEKFRNGLAHEFFPKMSGVSRDNSVLWSQSSEGYWVIDADIFTNMFIKSVVNLEEKIKDEDISIRIFQRFNKIQEKNLELKNIPTISISTSTSPLASLATTTTLPLSKGDTGVTGRWPKDKESYID